MQFELRRSSGNPNSDHYLVYSEQKLIGRIATSGVHATGKFRAYDKHDVCVYQADPHVRNESFLIEAERNHHLNAACKAIQEADERERAMLEEPPLYVIKETP